MKLQFITLAIFLALNIQNLTAGSNHRIGSELDKLFWTIDTLSEDSNAASNTNWWHHFDDPTLDTLINLAQERNYNVAASAKRINIARNQLTAARAGYFPTITASAAYSSENGDGNKYGIAASLSWEIDIFGKIQNRTDKASAGIKLSAAEHAGIVVSLDAQVAECYISILAGRQTLDVARRHAQNIKILSDKVNDRYVAGLASKLEVAQAQTLYYSTVASLPVLEAGIKSSINALAVLVNIAPDGLPTGVKENRTLPPYFLLPDIGVPSDLLRRRPDIIQAERNIDIAAAALGIARDEYLPSLTIEASIGTESGHIDRLFKHGSLSYNVAPTLSWTIFDGFARHSNNAAAQAELEARVDEYNMTVTTALGEVDNALIRYIASVKHIDTLKKVLEACQEEVRLSVNLYTGGLTQFSNVVDAQLNYLNYQNTLIAAHCSALSSLIELYKSLGGGWSE